MNMQRKLDRRMLSLLEHTIPLVLTAHSCPGQVRRQVMARSIYDNLNQLRAALSQHSHTFEDT